MITAYYFISKKRRPASSLLILGVLYFSISGLIYVKDSQDYISDIIKYFIVVLCAIEVVRDATEKDFFIILLIGAFTIFLNALYLQEGFGGRYGGVFINPNGAGFMCIIGYCLGYNVKNRYLKIIGQFVFTLAGFLTLSRTFIALWVIISLIAIIINLKNILTISIGVMAIILLLSISEFLNLDNVRFAAFQNLIENKVDSNVISENSRNETWLLYTEVILENIFFGNGYKSMQGMESDGVGIKVGVHNTYLMILGESGILTFIVSLIFFIRLLTGSIFKHFKKNPHYSFLAFALVIFLLTSHNYFDNYAMLTITLWVYSMIYDASNNNKITLDNEEINR